MSDLSYLILDGETGNGIAGFDDLEQAWACLKTLAVDFPKRADSLALVTFDAKGIAIRSETLGDLHQLA